MNLQLQWFYLRNKRLIFAESLHGPRDMDLTWDDKQTKKRQKYWVHVDWSL